MMTQAKKKSTANILLASLAGAGVGALAGVLLAPGSVQATCPRWSTPPATTATSWASRRAAS